MKAIRITIVIVIIILFLLLYYLVSIENKNIKENKIVTKIIDGDTIIVEGGENIRLIGIDCDEKGKKCYDAAKNKLEETLLNKVVYLESGNEKKDIYSRSLRYIFLDEKNINLNMVKEGYCVARFSGNLEEKYEKEIKNAERFAINNKIGCKWEDI
ncbi:MAG: thermonuclease family protein [Candidatus Pacearchaeota archaeon]